MCQTVPIRVKKIIKNSAMLSDGRQVDVSLLKNVRAGDWLLTNANLAIEKISSHEAGEVFKLLKLIAK